MNGTQIVGSMMAIVRFILGLELALSCMALAIVGIRAFGPKVWKVRLIHSIIACKRIMHLT